MPKGKEVGIVVNIHSKLQGLSVAERRERFLESIKRRDQKSLQLLLHAFRPSPDASAGSEGIR